MTTNSPLVAVVDDEESVCGALKRLPRASGFDVATSTSGADFLQFLRPRLAGCLVLDLHMPQMSGFDLREHLAVMADPMLIVIMTGHDTSQSRDRVMRAPAAAYLLNAVDDRALLDAVINAISRTPP